MQIKFTRAKAEKGMLTKHWEFSLTALMHMTGSERESFDRYKFGKDNLTDIAGHTLDPDQPMHALMNGVKLSELLQGRTFTSHNLQLIMDVEELVQTACEKALGYMLVADGFNGRERVLDVGVAKTEVVAST